MSLTSFIGIPEVREKFRKEFPMPIFNLKSPILCPPRTNHYGLVGTAFDYLLRFYLKYHNPQAITNEWVAELAVELTKPNSKLFKKTNSILQQAKEIYEKYLKTGEMNDEVIKTAIYLAQLDPIFRAGVIDPNLGIIDKNDVEDLRSLLSNIKLDTFKAKNICILNPTFGEGSHLVGGADADLLIDDTLIDVKTIKKLELDRNHFNQLIGYYILFKIGGIDQYQNSLEVKKLGVYFSRHGILFTIPIDTILNSTNIEDFTKWFKKKAKEHFPD
jgi:hypothetical protein